MFKVNSVRLSASHTSLAGCSLLLLSSAFKDVVDLEPLWIISSDSTHQTEAWILAPASNSGEVGVPAAWSDSHPGDVGAHAESEPGLSAHRLSTGPGRR